MTHDNSYEFVITAHGESAYLEACIQSVLAQTRRPEVIAISTSTPSPFLNTLARRYELEIRCNPIRTKIGASWNFALATSGARWVTLGHQDDLYLPEYCADMFAAMQRHPNALIGFCDSTEHVESAEIAPTLNLRVKRRLTERAFGAREAISTRDDKRKLLAWGNPICCPSVVFNRRLLENFAFSESMQSNLDWDAWTNFADADGEFVYVPQRLVSKRVHRGSETSALLINQIRQTEDRYMFGRHWPAPMASVIAMLYRLGYLANSR